MYHRMGYAMRILLLGASGMLGTAIRQVAHADERWGGLNLVCPADRFEWDIQEDYEFALLICKREKPDVIINAIGLRPEQGADAGPMIYMNGVLPHLIAQAAGGRARVIHVSTDCVLDRRPEWLSEGPVPWPAHYPIRPATIYGISKAAGEVDAPHVLNIRTSFIGPCHGLWPWFIEQAAGDAPIPGWGMAWWSGSTVWEVARGLLRIAAQGDAMEHGARHLATARPISKCRVLLTLAERMGIPEERVVRLDEPIIDRSLEPSGPMYELAPLDGEALEGEP